MAGLLEKLYGCEKLRFTAENGEIAENPQVFLRGLGDLCG